MNHAPVTPREIRETLEQRGLAPRHRLGQNFLVEPLVLDRIVDAAGLSPGDGVLEVGPGLGGLTERLLARDTSVLAVELDRGLAAHLRQLFHGHARFVLLERDVLAGGSKWAPEVTAAWTNLHPSRRFVVANLPYGISSPFLAGLASGCSPVWVRAVVTLQKELGAVLTADPGQDEYSPLSFLARMALSVRVLRELPPECFYPRPKVRSVVVALEPASGVGPLSSDLITFVRTLFQGRRKALRGTLRGAALAAGRALLGEPSDLLVEVGIGPTDRVDGVEPAALVELFARLTVEALPASGSTGENGRAPSPCRESSGPP